jgi:hypothetical protein
LRGTPDEPLIQPGDTPGHPMAAWFADRRRFRGEHYATRPERIRSRGASAALTIVQNESLFLPIWLGYYSRFFDPEDIYVLDHDSDDGSTAAGGFVRIPVSHPTFDNTWMVSTVERLQRELLERYEVVLVVDVDEIVAPDPAWGTLEDYLARFDEDWVNCLGYEVLHMREREPPFTPGVPVLEQRGWWYPNDLYDKPSIARIPLEWRPGFHGRRDYHFNLDPDLRLIHLHRMDYDICRARHERWTAMPWNEKDLEAGWGTHNRVTQNGEFERWFYTDSTAPGIRVLPEPVPERWRAVV